MMFQQMTLNVFQTCGHRLLCTFNVWDPTESVATRPLFTLSNPGSYKFFYTFDGNKNVSELVHFETRNGIAAHYDYAPTLTEPEIVADLMKRYQTLTQA
jgi:hypothetical protein